MAQADSSADSNRPKPPRARGGLAGPFILIGVAVVLALVGLYYWPEKHVPVPVPKPKPADRVTMLERRVETDEARLSSLENSAHVWNGLAARIAVLERNQQSAVVPPAVSSAPLPSGGPPPSDSFASKTDEAALAARVAKLESEDVGRALDSAAAALAFANLSRATDGSGDFARELAALSPLMAAPETRDLARYSKGVATRTALAAEFSEVADRALAAGRRAKAKTWLGRLWVNLSSLVTIRPVGKEAGRDPESVFARASADLRAGSLDGAVQELRTLNGAERAAVDTWLKEAEARIAVDRDMHGLTDRLAAMLAQHPGVP